MVFGSPLLSGSKHAGIPAGMSAVLLSIKSQPGASHHDGS